jgi:hypothetical protein
VPSLTFRIHYSPLLPNVQPNTTEAQLAQTFEHIQNLIRGIAALDSNITCVQLERYDVHEQFINDEPAITDFSAMLNDVMLLGLVQTHNIKQFMTDLGDALRWLIEDENNPFDALPFNEEEIQQIVGAYRELYGEG